MPPADKPLRRRVNAAEASAHSMSKDTLSMTIQIDQWNFTGPFNNTGEVNSRSGVYAILTRPNSTAQYNLVDAGESGDLRSRLDAHDRKECWRRNNAGELAVAVLYCDERSRMAVEARLRTTFNPACGIR